LGARETGRPFPTMADDTIPFPEPPPFDRLADAELHRLELWAARSALPAWRDFDPAMPSTPPETIHRLIAERHALRAILETVGEFHGSLSAVMKRMGVSR
jgi:hypothetical protein